MKKLFIALASVFLFGCRQERVFNGQLTYIDEAREEVVITSDTLWAEGLYSSFFAVVDSLAILYTPSDRNYSFSVRRLPSLDEVGRYVARGNGYGEVYSVGPVSRIASGDSHAKAWLYDPNGQAALLWDISASIAEGKTVYEDTIPYPEPNDGHPAGYSLWYPLDKDRSLVLRGSVHCSDGTINPPLWQVREFPDTTLIKTIRMFNAIPNDHSVILPESFFSLHPAIKPDNTKFVGAMCWLPQINIINLDTGEAKGYLLKNRTDYDVFYSDMRDAQSYYIGVQADDDHIYALWCGEPTATRDRTKGMDEIHVFNWNGKMEKRLKLTNPVDYIFLDVERRWLYGYHETLGCLYKYDLSLLTPEKKKYNTKKQ